MFFGKNLRFFAVRGDRGIQIKILVLNGSPKRKKRHITYSPGVSGGDGGSGFAGNGNMREPTERLLIEGALFGVMGQ